MNMLQINVKSTAQGNESLQHVVILLEHSSALQNGHRTASPIEFPITLL